MIIQFIVISLTIFYLRPLYKSSLFCQFFWTNKNNSCEWNFWGCNFFYFYIVSYCWWQHNARIFPPQIYFFLWRKVNLLDKRSRMVRNHAFVMMKVKRLRQCLICGFLHLRLVFFQLAAEKKKCLSLFHRSLTPKDRCSVKTGSNTNEVIAYSETFHNHTMQAAKIT